VVCVVANALPPTSVANEWMVHRALALIALAFMRKEDGTRFPIQLVFVVLLLQP
jgi:hypothetical protein